MIRPIVWFAAASMATTILHEFAHAGAAFVLGVRSTLFNYSANLDLTPAQAASDAPALIRVAGPLCCLAFGTITWWAFRRRRDATVALPLLYLSVFALGTFFGNLMSTAFVGDFSAAAISLRLPMTMRYAVSVAGAIAVAGLHFWAGRELVQWVPAHVGRVAGMLRIVALPVLAGTAAVILVNQPMPAASMNARVAEASFWLFAGIGAVVTTRHPPHAPAGLVLRWYDGVCIVVAILVVRLMVRGILFAP